MRIVSIAIFIVIHVTPLLTQSNINSNQTFGLTIDRYPNEFNTSYTDFLYFNLKLAKSKKDTEKLHIMMLTLTLGLPSLFSGLGVRERSLCSALTGTNKLFLVHFT
jgi:hypothetical protein